MVFDHRAFHWLIDFSDCTGKRLDIARVMDSQDGFLLDYLLYEKWGLKPDALSSVKTLIEKREGMIQLKIENFRAACRSCRNRGTLASLLNQYRSYLYLKQATLKEKQSFSWLEDLAVPDRLKDDLSK